MASRRVHLSSDVTRRWTCSLSAGTAQAREDETPRQQAFFTRHADLSIVWSMFVSRGAR